VHGSVSTAVHWFGKGELKHRITIFGNRANGDMTVRNFFPRLEVVSPLAS
jgi:hypothetical protein